MRPRHGGTISRLCAFRRGHSGCRRRHRERARHCGGAAAAVLAERATEWHDFAVPAVRRADRCTVSWHRGSARRTPSVHSAHASWPAAWWRTVSGPSRTSTPATGSRASQRRASTFRPASMQSSCLKSVTVPSLQRWTDGGRSVRSGISHEVAVMATPVCAKIIANKIARLCGHPQPIRPWGHSSYRPRARIESPATSTWHDPRRRRPETRRRRALPSRHRSGGRESTGAWAATRPPCCRGVARNV